MCVCVCVGKTATGEWQLDPGMAGNYLDVIPVTLYL